MLQTWLETHTIDEDGAVRERRRGEPGISQTAFAARLQFDRAMLWRWMVGERSPSIDNAAAIEAATGTPARLWASSKSLRGEGA